MEITLETLRTRHSVRTYAGPCDASQIRKLNAVLTDINTHAVGMHFQLITNDPGAFGSFTKSYGMFKGVTDYVACVADTSYAHPLERAGYYGMQVVAEAVALGLGTCFVSATYSKDAVSARVRAGEELVMIIAIGQMPEVPQASLSAKLMRGILHRRKGLTPMDFLDTTLPWEKICAAFPKILSGLEAVSYAPSAMNKQPVGILIKKTGDPYNPIEKEAKGNKAKKKLQHREELSARYDSLLHPKTEDTDLSEAATATTQSDYILQAYVPAKNKAQLIDLGIAMYSFSVAYPGSWEWGNPATFLPDE